MLTVGWEVYGLVDPEARAQERKATGLASGWKSQACPSVGWARSSPCFTGVLGTFLLGETERERVKALFAVTESLLQLRELPPSPSAPHPRHTRSVQGELSSRRMETLNE